MQSGAWGRNAIVLLLYMTLLMIAVPVVPLLLGVAVGYNWKGWASRLSRFPGISATGGATAGAVTVVYGYVLLTGSYAVAAAGGDTGETASTPTSTPTPTPTPAATPTETTDTESTTATPITTPTPDLTRTETSSDASPTPTSSPTPDSVSGSSQTEFIVTVTEVIDGDTIDIRYRNGSTDTVRFLGVDTAEVNTGTEPSDWEGVPSTDAARDCLRAAGEDASKYVASEIEGDSVTIRLDEEADRRGSFGRLLAYVIDGEQNLNYQLVVRGDARVYDAPFTQSTRFYDAEDQARTDRAGAWRCQDTATPTPTPVADGGSLAVVEIHEDAQGDEYENLNDEYVVFENTGNSNLDISGWQIEDEADHVYEMPSGTTVDAGEQITLKTGSGSDTDRTLYWGQEAPVWNNGGDTVHVRTDSGELVAERSYD